MPGGGDDPLHSNVQYPGQPVAGAETADMNRIDGDGRDAVRKIESNPVEVSLK
jgi:hypothetical protein